MLNRLLRVFGYSLDEWWNLPALSGKVIIPPELIDEFKEIANRHRMSVDQVYQTFLKIGFLADLASQKGEYLYVLKDGEYLPFDPFLLDSNEED